MPVTLRSTKGSPLSHAEVDANFSILDAIYQSYPAPTLTWTVATNAGTTSYGNGGFTTGNMFRFADRVFIAEAANKFAGNSLAADGGTSWVTGIGYWWLSANAAMALHTTESTSGGKYGFVSIAKLATGMNASGSIAIGAAQHLNKSGGSGWALYADLNHELGTVGYAAEFAAKNRSSEVTADSYSTSSGGGTFGIHINTGDNSFGGNALYNSTAAINIGGGNGGNTKTFNVGIRFASASLTRDGSNYAVAISMAQKHTIEWMVSAGVRASIIRSDNATASTDTSLVFEANALSLYGTNSKRILYGTHATNGVNYYQITNAATTVYPTLSAQGDDTNVGMFILAKGDGSFRFASNGNVASEHVRIGNIVSSPVNYVHMYGGTSGNGVALTVGGSDTNSGLVISPKGSSQVQIRSGDATTKIAVNNTGIAFFAGTPVGRQTVGAALSTGGAETNTNLATRINELRTALINYNLAA